MSLLAGIGVLLLAMGVGVLIGRSGSSARTPAPQVVTIGGAPTTSSAGTEEPFTSDWPAAKKGWTVALQTLPAGSTTAAVSSAKTAAEGKGARSVGALKVEQFPSVGGEGFLVYSGEYSSKSAASKALAGLKKSFPTAKVVEVSSGSSSASKAGGSGGSGVKVTTKTPPPTEQSFKHPAKLPSGTGSSHGKKAVEESAKLPDIVETP